jgi:hypothetical protein
MKSTVLILLVLSASVTECIDGVAANMPEKDSSVDDSESGLVLVLCCPALNVFCEGRHFILVRVYGLVDRELYQPNDFPKGGEHNDAREM